MLVVYSNISSTKQTSIFDHITHLHEAGMACAQLALKEVLAL